MCFPYVRLATGRDVSSSARHSAFVNEKVYCLVVISKCLFLILILQFKDLGLFYIRMFYQFKSSFLIN